MSRADAQDVWAEVRSILLISGPLTVAELYNRVECAEDKKQLVNVLFSRKQKGLLVHEGRRYSLPGPAKGDKPASKQEPDPPPKTPAVSSKPAADPVDEFLKGSLDAAQHALDEYLVSVGDPDLIVQLKGARDYAKRALETYRRARS